MTTPYLYTKSRDRFWSNVTKDADGCWRKPTTRKDGYSRFSSTAVFAHGENYAHRIAWREANDWVEIPKGYDIDHMCRTRNCVNPDHLRCIPHAENLIGRVQTVRNQRAKLTDEQVHEIRRLLNEGRGYTEIATVIGCFPMTVLQIHRGATYKWVA